MGAFDPLAFDRITAVLQGMSLGMKAFTQHMGQSSGYSNQLWQVMVVVKVVNIVPLIVLSMIVVVNGGGS